MLLQTAKAQKAADNRFTHGGGDLLALIRSAAEGLADAVLKRAGDIRSSDPESSRTDAVFLIGPGNNGNDGLAAAEIVANKDKNITVRVFRPESLVRTGDKNADTLEKRLNGIGVKVFTVDNIFILQDTFASLIRSSCCVVDCLFGSGFDPERPFPEDVSNLISVTNAHSPFTISADIASGVSSDTGATAEAAIRADVTVTFGAPKPGHFILPGKRLTGELRVSKILITEGLFGVDAPECFVKADRGAVRALLPKRDPYGNKYTMGRVLVIAGSLRYAGAAILAVSSALRGGAGLVTAAVPFSIVAEVTAACPEAVRLPLGNEDTLFMTGDHVDMLVDASSVSSAVVIGPGLGREPETVEAVLSFLKKTRCKKIVVDADALFALASNSKDAPALFEGKEAVLTPHAGEAARLLSVEPSVISSKRLLSAMEISSEYSAVTLLKGNDTIICGPSGRYTVNNTGNTALSKGGSGDVLAGLIGSLLASGTGAYDAARAGAFIHGLAAETLSEKSSEYSVLPGDLPLAFSELMC